MKLRNQHKIKSDRTNNKKKFIRTDATNIKVTSETLVETNTNTGHTVYDIMNHNLFFTNAGTSITEVSKIMQIQNVNALVIGNESSVYGIITDRDIAIRVVAQNKDPSSTMAGDIMSKDIYPCLMTDSVNTAEELMKKHNTAHLLVKNNEGKICGTISSFCAQRNGCIQRRLNDLIILSTKPNTVSSKRVK